MSIFEKMKKDTRLRSNLKAAKEVSPDDGQISNKDFPGPDGEYIFLWSGYNDFEGKDGTQYVEFIFTATHDNDQPVVNKKCNIFLAFKDSGKVTMEDVQENFFKTLQQLGIATPNLSPEEIQAAIKDFCGKIKIKAAVVTSKSNSDYRNLYLRTLIEGEVETEETPAKPVKKAAKTAAPTKKTPTKSSPPAKQAEPEPEDEWEEVEEEAEEETEEEDWKPSTSIGYECVYQDETLTVVKGDDDANTIDLEDADGAGYVDVPFDDVEWVEEE